MIDDDRRNPAEEAADKAQHLARRSWVPERIDGETDADYMRRYTIAELRALLDGRLPDRRRATYIDGFGEKQWADPAGGRFS